MTPLARKAALAIVLLGAVAGTASSQEKKEGSTPRVKIAVVNYGHLFINYDRAKELKKELDDALQPLKTDAERIKSAMIGQKTAVQNPNVTPEAAEFLNEQLREGTRALEDLDSKARKMVGKRQETQLVDLWKDINDTVTEYASKNDFDIVFGYGDPPNLDAYTFANVNRRMTAMDMGTVIPAYVRNGADITRNVLPLLQDKYRASRQASKKQNPNPPIDPRRVAE
jgi:Skp family chaperone for outer membrane proteins